MTTARPRRGIETPQSSSGTPPAYLPIAEHGVIGEATATPDGRDGDESTFSMWIYSEQVGTSGELLGNLLQAFTHLALISAAVDLDRRLAYAGV